MNNEKLKNIKFRYNGRLKFLAKNDAFEFYIFDDKWKLSHDTILNLEWMNEINYSEHNFIIIRTLFAEMACVLSAKSVSIYSKVIRKIAGETFSIDELKILWPSISTAYKRQFSNAMAFACNNSDSDLFGPLYKFSLDNTNFKARYEHIFDPYKGCYSTFEYQSIKESFRIKSHELIIKAESENISIDLFLNLADLLACHLLNALVRRVIQISMMKWADILPVGVRFKDHKLTNLQSVPTDEPEFSDVEKLHVRTFRGKNGTFRYDAERRSCVLETDLSYLVMLYRQKYQELLKGSLKSQDILLSTAELTELMYCCPIFPSRDLFSLTGMNKKKVFEVIGLTSPIFHLITPLLSQRINRFQKNMNLRSDRIDDNKLKLSNNRFRHTILTNSARSGMTAPQLATITGVTQSSVKHYIDLSFDARLDINKAFATNEIIKKFGEISVKEMKLQNGIVFKSEFDEEIGLQANPETCSSCDSRAGAPLGCYPCHNFIPHEEADHEFYLKKAIQKFETNKASGSNHETIKKFSNIIFYIKATIEVCSKRLLIKKGISND